MANKVPQATKELAKALYIQGLRFPAISSHTGVAQNVLRTWAGRYAWKDLATQALQLPQQTLKRGLGIETANTLAAMGDQIRDKLSQELLAQVQLLANRPPSDISDLATVKGIQGRASVVKTIAETAAVVHDWGSQSSAGLVLVGELSREPGESLQAPVEIFASIEPAQLQPNPDTPTDSVPADPQSLSPDNPLPLQG